MNRKRSPALDASRVDELASLVDGMLADLGASPETVSARRQIAPVEGSLFDRCIDLCREASERTRRDGSLRSIHHLSCTGGTLMVRCLAAMPNTLVLNEVDPLSLMQHDPDRPRFSLTDLIALTRMGDPTASDAVIADLFAAQLERLHAHCQRHGRRLLLRDHSHSRFLAEPVPNARPSLRALLRDRFTLLSVVTVRDPIDSWISMQAAGWVSFEPAHFDEYCRRSLAFLDAHEDLPRFRYEDFVARPLDVMRSMCEALELPFSPLFLDTFEVFRFSGDSGRAGGFLEARPPRRVAPDLLAQAEASTHYETLCTRLDYTPVWLDEARLPRPDHDDKGVPHDH